MAGNTRRTIRARVFGAELRATREAAGLGLRGLAKLLDTSHATVSRWETGARRPGVAEVAAYLQAVRAPTDVRERLLGMADEPDAPRWLSIGMPEQPRQLATLLEIERAATRITTVSPLLVPGLMQTADYARDIMISAEVPPSEIDTRVAVRLGRRDAINRKKPVQLNAFVGELALRQAIGSDETMVDQLRELLKLAEQPNVMLRVLPIRTGWHAGLEGPFVLVEFDDRDPVISIENRVSALYLDEPEDVSAYRSALPRVEQMAMSEAESTSLIADIVEEWEEQDA
ncbi:helix-turn-helix transcriptional regulator [Saccharopolyspora sp. ID03-671]|uniref:helix-turn-helix domain-containing protein n=1 Tax=Saccharopolyspora sp. ID03-671 TaxID=3073066 RepID=UPI003255B005